MSLIEDFISLIFPNICACCGNSLWKHEKVICTFCDFHLPRTHFHLERDNAVSRTFWGRVRIESAAALYYFNKGNRVQTLVHQLKYKGRRDIGIYLGEKYGLLLKHSPFFNTIDVIIPVPLHKRKRMKRGYNQSGEFAAGLGKAMQLPVDRFSLVRRLSNETQTRKSRYRRWQNVKDTFMVVHPKEIEGKHILLVDDVLTTGATLEACILALSALSNVKVSVVTIAFANR